MVMSPFAVDLRDLRFRWPRTETEVLDIERLSVTRGERLFLAGPSGSGKSSLLALMAGVNLPTHGRIELLGHNWAALPPARRDAFRAAHLGIVFQQFNLLPYLSALDNVLLPCRFSRTRAQRARESDSTIVAAATRLLGAVGLPTHLYRAAATALSVGEQQRVAAARALIGAPEVVIADEPTSALDAARRDEFIELLLGACASTQSTLIFVSHDERLARHFDRRLELPTINRARRTTPSLA